MNMMEEIVEFLDSFLLSEKLAGSDKFSYEIENEMIYIRKDKFIRLIISYEYGFYGIAVVYSLLEKFLEDHFDSKIVTAESQETVIEVLRVLFRLGDEIWKRY